MLGKVGNSLVYSLGLHSIEFSVIVSEKIAIVTA